MIDQIENSCFGEFQLVRVGKFTIMREAVPCENNRFKVLLLMKLFISTIELLTSKYGASDKYAPNEVAGALLKDQPKY